MDLNATELKLLYAAVRKYNDSFIQIDDGDEAVKEQLDRLEGRLSDALAGSK